MKYIILTLLFVSVQTFSQNLLEFNNSDRKENINMTISTMNKNVKMLKEKFDIKKIELSTKESEFSPIKQKGNYSDADLQQYFDIENDKGEIEELKSRIDSLEAMMKELLKEKKNDTKATELNILGNLVSKLGNSVISPTLSLNGNYPVGNSLIQLRVFTSAEDNDTSKSSLATNLFLTEKSLYGLSLSGLYATSKNFGLNASIIFTGKNITGYDDSLSVKENENISLINLKAGLEFAPVTGKVSVFLNWNFLLVATKVDGFKKIFGDDKKEQVTFFEFGIKGLVNLTDDKDKSLFLEMKLIYADDKVQEVTGKKDKIIPLISIGYLGNILGKVIDTRK